MQLELSCDTISRISSLKSFSQEHPTWRTSSSFCFICRLFGLANGHQDALMGGESEGTLIRYQDAEIAGTGKPKILSKTRVLKLIIFETMVFHDTLFG